MYNLSNFVAYNNEPLKADTQVLLWSRATGYFFTTAQAVAGDLQVIAVKG